MRDQRYSGRKRQSRDLRDRDQRMYDAVCDQCGKSCKVPFQPTSGKPIYCSDCFEQQSGNRSNRRSSRRDSRRRGSDDRQMYTVICDECGKKCEVPFKPSGDKPIYCEECFREKGDGREGKSRDRRGQRDNRIQEQIDIINSKLDYLIKELEEFTRGKTVRIKKEDESKKEETVKKEADVKEEKEKPKKVKSTAKSAKNKKKSTKATTKKAKSTTRKKPKTKKKTTTKSTTAKSKEKKTKTKKKSSTSKSPTKKK